MHQHIAQSYIAAVFGLVANGVFFADVFSFDDDGGHEFSKKSKVKGEKLIKGFCQTKKHFRDFCHFRR